MERFNHINFNKQGNVGLGAAIAFFTKLGFTVCVPLTDSQDYDLIVDCDGLLKRVQVKTTGCFERNSYTVSLSTKGGNRSGTGKVKFIDKNIVDELFVLTASGTQYRIPTSRLRSRHCLALSVYGDCQVT